MFVDFLGTFIELAGGSIVVIVGAIVLALFVERAVDIYCEDKRKND